MSKKIPAVFVGLMTIISLISAVPSMAFAEREGTKNSLSSQQDDRGASLSENSGLGLKLGVLKNNEESSENEQENNSNPPSSPIAAPAPETGRDSLQISPSGAVSAEGRLTSLNNASGALVMTVFGIQINVNAGGAVIVGNDSSAASFSDLKIGDSIRLLASSIDPSSGVVTARRIMDRSLLNVAGNTTYLEQRIQFLLNLLAQLQSRLHLGGGTTIGPVISAISASNVGTSSVAINWTTDEQSRSKVYFGTSTPLDINSAASVSDATLVVNHSLVLNSLSAGTTYFAIVESADASGNISRSGQISFATLPLPDTTPPVISSVSATSTASTTASISWTTNEPASSKIYFGTASPLNLTTASSVYDASLVLSHSMNLTGLNSSTTYFFAVESHDASGNVFTSSEQSFVTLP